MEKGSGFKVLGSRFWVLSRIFRGNIKSEPQNSRILKDGFALLSLFLIVLKGKSGFW